MNCVKNPRNRMSPALVNNHLKSVFEISFKRYLFLLLMMERRDGFLISFAPVMP